MPKLTPARIGSRISIHGRDLDFSLWPVKRRRGAGATINTRLFVADPWPVMLQAANGLETQDRRNAARAFIEQGQDFYRAASTASTTAAKPLLLYYAFLNVAKALILVRKPEVNLDGAMHGLSEKLHNGGQELTGAYLEAQANSNRPLVFKLLYGAIADHIITGNTNYDVPKIMRQIVTGHRLFLGATGKSIENFLAPAKFSFLHDIATHVAWLRIELSAGDLGRVGLGQRKLLELSRLAPNWRFVRAPEDAVGSLWLEAQTPRGYTQGWISDSVMPIVDSIRHKIWQTVLSVPPYRAYYFYFPSSQDLQFVLPQILSAYALIFYFGSITRYRPHHFDRILAGPYGAFVENFFQDQPSQLLFLFASEFAQRDVTKAALA